MTAAARLVSANVGRTRSVEWQGRTLRTAIWKTPVEGRVATETDRLAGDRQADGRYHGGPRKAVYAYAAEHYAAWRREVPELDLAAWGSFGENLTTEGLLEDDVRVGDLWRIGSAEFEVTQPRTPCSKLAVRFGREDMTALFTASSRFGFYLSIARAGDVGAGDAIERLSTDSQAPTIAERIRRRR